jgi:hypothetical protein
MRIQTGGKRKRVTNSGENAPLNAKARRQTKRQRSMRSTSSSDSSEGSDDDHSPVEMDGSSYTLSFVNSEEVDISPEEDVESVEHESSA